MIATRTLHVAPFLLLAACRADAPDRAPLAPVGTSADTTHRGAVRLWGMVVEESGVCIVGATVRMTRGQSLGSLAAQSTPCDAWAYDGGFVFDNLRADEPMTIIAAAPGYASVEQTVVPKAGPQYAVLFTLPLKQ